MNLKGERVMVTGAGGFIGSHLAEMLVSRGAKVRAVVHYNSRNDRGNLEYVSEAALAEMEIRSIDITDPFSVREAVKDCSCVFHLAALIGIPYSYVAPAAYVEVNVRGTLNVLEAIRLCGHPRLVHASTSETYGTAVYTPIDEQHPLKAQSPYAASKIAADKLVESYRCSFGLETSTLRPFNAFGPRQSVRAVIPTIVTQLLNGETVRLGNLSPVRDFTYVTDTAAAFIAIAESDATVGELCNAGSGRTLSIGELAQKLVEMLEPGAPIISEQERYRPPESEVMALICSSEKLRSLTSWEPKVTLDEGLRLTADFVGRQPKTVGNRGYVI